jgi:hypothetical protein
MEPAPHSPDAVPAGLEIPPADWQQTPPSVQALVVTLLQRVWKLSKHGSSKTPPRRSVHPRRTLLIKRPGSLPETLHRAKRVGNPAILGIGSLSWPQPRPGGSRRNSARVARQP